MNINSSIVIYPKSREINLFVVEVEPVELELVVVLEVTDELVEVFVVVVEFCGKIVIETQLLKVKPELLKATATK